MGTKMYIPSTRPKCSAITRAGAPCKRQAERGSALCVMHDPALADVRRAFQKRGGSAKKPRHKSLPHALNRLEASLRELVIIIESLKQEQTNHVKPNRTTTSH